MEDRTIDMEIDGIRFISHGHYYDGINNWLCHKLKENDPQAITYCARQLVKMLPENAVVVPIPGHHGFALQTLYLARAINEQSGGIIPVANESVGLTTIVFIFSLQEIILIGNAIGGFLFINGTHFDT